MKLWKIIVTVFFFITVSFFQVHATQVLSFQENVSSLSDKKQNCDDIKLQILGEGGPEIDDGLASTSYLIWINNKARVLVDAGGGSSLNFEKSKANFNDLQSILLTHLHVDHSAALPIYLKGSFFTGRDTVLPLFGPSAAGAFPSTESFINALFSNNKTNDKLISAYPYLADTVTATKSSSFYIKAQSIQPTQNIWSKKINDSLKISAISIHHGPIPAVAWRVDHNHCSVTFSGDMNGDSGNLPKLAHNTNLLVAHNAVGEQAHPIAKNLHMTPSKIAEIAQQAKVKKLVLSHFMKRTINDKPVTKKTISTQYKGEIIFAEALRIISLD